MNGWIMLSKMCYVPLLVTLDIRDMQQITGFSMKDCLSAPGLGWKYLNSLRTEEVEPLYTYNEK